LESVVVLAFLHHGTPAATFSTTRQHLPIEQNRRLQTLAMAPPLDGDAIMFIADGPDAK